MAKEKSFEARVECVRKNPGEQSLRQRKHMVYVYEIVCYSAWIHIYKCGDALKNSRSLFMNEQNRIFMNFFKACLHAEHIIGTAVR